MKGLSISETGVTPFYAGIGARDTPAKVLGWMERISARLDQKGYCLRSGGARGADTAFERHSTRKEIFTTKGHIPLWCDVFVEHFHPNPDALRAKGEGSVALMARNSMQILGRSGDCPVDFVICWTKGGKVVGGTGQAIKIAEHFGIKVFNLCKSEDVSELKRLLKEFGV